MPYLHTIRLLQTGWDTDQFLTDPREATLLMHTLLKHGGVAPGGPPLRMEERQRSPGQAVLLRAEPTSHTHIPTGGLNFDAKMRRESTSLEDFFYAHIRCGAGSLIACRERVVERLLAAQQQVEPWPQHPSARSRHPRPPNPLQRHGRNGTRAAQRCAHD